MTRAMLTGLALIWLAAAPARATEAGADPKQRAEALVASARERVAAEDFAAAAAAYAEALELYPGWNIPEAGDWPRVRARRARADLWQSMKQYGKARAELRAAFDYPARDQLELIAWIHELIGDSFAAEGNWAEAEQAFHAAVRTGLYGGARDRVPTKLEDAKSRVQTQLQASPHAGIRTAMHAANRVLVSTVAMPWRERERSLDGVLSRLDEAGKVGSDIVLLPMECVITQGEPIPGPISRAIGDKAREHGMYVIGNIREIEGDKTYVTSFLVGRDGQIVGKYRKSHKLPDENIDLGDDLPVFETDFGKIAMRIGSDRFFPDIDHVYTAKGARMIFWSQEWEPMEDEHMQDFPSAGRARDYNVFIVCARYAPAWSNPLPSFFQQGNRRGDPIGKAYVIERRSGTRIAGTSDRGGVATAVIPRGLLDRPGRGANPHPAFKVLTDPVALPEARHWAKRKVRVTAIDNHVDINTLLNRLDEAGALGSDFVVTYEFVWIRGDQPDVPGQIARAQNNLRRIREKAKEHEMYVMVVGVIDRLERNEAILYDRRGEEVGRYYKMAKTHPEMIPGQETNVLETDFGRIGVRICADNPRVEIDRSYAVKGIDILVDSTQDWGCGGVHRMLRNVSRAMDGQFFRIEATHASTDSMHASHIVEPTGAVVARSAYGSAGLVSAVIDLDNDRPQRYLRQESLEERRRSPGRVNDLRETILRQRRPELYQVLAPER